ncbi:MAG: tetratricopeptide repeat protein [Brevinema sp.]
MKNISKKLCLLALLPISLHAMSFDQASFQVGQRFFTQELYTEAEIRFLDIVKKHPDSSYYREALFYLGQTYAAQGKYKSSLQYYKILMSKARNADERQKGLLGIAKNWLQLGDHKQAAEFYTLYVTQYPESEHAATALYFAGIAWERQGNNPEAIEKFRALIDQYPDTPLYAKSIEKLALLDTKSADEMFLASASKSPQNSNFTNTVPQIHLFDEKELNIAPIPNKSKVDFRAQEINLSNQELNAAPSIMTQTILQQPSIITQEVIQTVTQFVEKGASALTNSSKDSSAVVHLTNGEYVPLETAEQKARREELEVYKKLWEDEYKAKLKNKELDDAHESVKSLMQLMQSKAQVLSVKESTLQEKQNEIKGLIYKDLEQISSSSVNESAPLIPVGGIVNTDSITIKSNTLLKKDQPAPVAEVVSVPAEEIAPEDVISEEVNALVESAEGVQENSTNQ